MIPTSLNGAQFPERRSKDMLEESGVGISLGSLSVLIVHSYCRQGSRVGTAGEGKHFVSRKKLDMKGASDVEAKMLD